MLYGWTEQNSVYVILFACLKYLKYFILGIRKVDITRTLCISQTDISHKEMLAASLRYLDFSFGLLLLATPLWPQKVFVRLSVMRVTVKLLGVFDMLSADKKSGLASLFKTVATVLGRNYCCLLDSLVIEKSVRLSLLGL